MKYSSKSKRLARRTDFRRSKSPVASSSTAFEVAAEKLTPRERQLLEHFPSRFALDEDGYLRVKSRTTSKFTSRRAAAATGMRAKRAKDSKEQDLSRSPSPVWSHTHPPPAGPPPAPVQWSWSPFSLLSPFSSFPFMLGSMAVIAVAVVIFPLTSTFAHIAQRISDINPIEAIIGPTIHAIATIPVRPMLCESVGLYCPESQRNAAFVTDSYTSLVSEAPAEQISLGNDFFDCLDDLQKVLLQTGSISHLKTLGEKAMQFNHILEDAEGLSDNIRALVRAHASVILNANAARISGSKGVLKIINQFEQVRQLASSELSTDIIQRDLTAGLSSAQESLKRTSDHTQESSRSVRASEELATLVAEQAHREISRLRRITNEEQMGLTYLAYGWTRPAWGLLQPGRKGRQQDRELAGEFLKELIRRLDTNNGPRIKTILSLQQCAINTDAFNEQIQQSFAFDRHPIPIPSQIERLIPEIEGLSASLHEHRKNDSTLRLNGPQNTPSASSSEPHPTKQS